MRTTDTGNRLACAVLAGLALLMLATVAAASPNAIYVAASKYAQCDLRWFGRIYAGLDGLKVTQQLARCRTAYDAAWNRQTHDPRFVDYGNGTVQDNLTGLQWEQKTDDGGLHDKDDEYSWSGGLASADGTAYASFLAALNGACFAGHCDWRLPTRLELDTIVLAEPFPCSVSPCIDTSLFGPTAATFYWSATTSVTGEEWAWGVQFDGGLVGAAPKSMAFAVRAVRGGF